MLTRTALDRAMPGRQNAKDWLTLKIVECTAVPMDDRMAECLAVYNSAYNALCQWGEDSPQQKDSQETQGFTLPMAKAWTEKMENEDGTRGPHWSIEQAKQLMSQRSLTYDPNIFWVALNMIYSDYVKVAKKFGVGDKIDFYVDMAKAFLDDKDAGPDKLAKYYKYIVR